MWVAISSFLFSMVTIIAAFATIAGFVINVIDRHNNKKHIQDDTTYELCGYFQQQVIPHFFRVFDMNSNLDVNIINKISYDKETGDFYLPKLKNRTEYMAFLNEVMFLFNEMDEFAKKIQDGRVDIDLAYKLQGNTFCDIISSFKHLYDLYVELDGEAYKDLDKLYKLWNHRLQ